jgi:pentatricopeptide repeat protein
MQDEFVESLPEDNIPMIEPMLHCLLEGLIKNHEIDRAIFLFRDLRARGVKPRVQTYNLMISLCCDNIEPEEAFRILIDVNDTHGEGCVVEHYWWRVLEICAREQYVPPKTLLG